MLTTDKEKAICEKYSTYDKNNRVHCNESSSFIFWLVYIVHRFKLELLKITVLLFYNFS